MSGGTFWSGLYFVTADAYDFSPQRNLALATVMGALSVAGAWSSGWLARTFRPRTVLLVALALWTLSAILPVVVPGSEGMLWLGAMVGSVTSSMVWPIVESYVSAGRHGSEMRRALGLFNITWTPATALPLFAMPLLAHLGATASLGLAAGVSAAAMLLVLGLPANPGHHEKQAAVASTGPEYPHLAQTTSWLLPLSYVLATMVSPLLPYRLAALGLGPNASIVAALWMAVRFATFVIMWRSAFWHGRWGTLLLGGGALLGGMSAVLLGGSLSVVVIGLLLFGTGIGLVYYSALYYALTVGHAAVDASGKFEALVGLGSAVGPLLGLGGRALAGERHEAPTVLLGMIVVLFALPGILRPYRRARHQRKG